VICTVGDLLLDVVCRLDGPIEQDTDTFGRTRVSAGGQAANVAAWVVALGGRARFVGKRARDPAGRILREELTDRGVELVGPEIASGTGTVVSISTPDGRRSMLTDRGISPTLTQDEIDPAWISGCEWLHVPAYSLVISPLREASLSIAAEARQSGAKVSVDLSSTSAVELFGVQRFAATLDELRPDVVFGNEEEIALVPSLEAPIVAIKRGARGCLIRKPGTEEAFAALPVEVVDTTGAGDAFSAGFLVGGIRRALEAASRCVATMGAVP
jgi:sugar/nucleoside kinase (ribokinase family)